MESLICAMLDGHIRLDEAIHEFEKIYIQTALERNGSHLSKTAVILGIHRNTLSKRVSTYEASTKRSKPLLAKRAK